MAIEALELVQHAERRIINVASVPMRSPFRYPGGKTWFVPYVRQWLRSIGEPPAELFEPFAGGGIVGLTAAFEGLAQTAVLVELDSDVAAVWHTIINGQGMWLADRIRRFELTPESLRNVMTRDWETIPERAFATILRNRTSRGGILAPGAGFVKEGENGKGLASRWYPETLHRRIRDIVRVRTRLRFFQADGLRFMDSLKDRSDAVFFIDPPYTVAGRRLYAHNEIDHEGLFRVASSLRGDFVMTYDDAPEIRMLARRHGFEIREVPMKSTHHVCKNELVIGRKLSFLDV